MNKVPSLRSITMQKKFIKGEARLASFLSSLLILITAGLFSFMANAASSAGKSVYGPETFSPGLYARSFQIAAPTGQYTLSVLNGNSLTGQNRTDSAVITLNGKIVLGVRDLTAKSASVEKPVSLKKLNILTILVVGKKGSFITFSIKGQTANTSPVANAGPDQTGKVNTTVNLDGSTSSDFDGNLLTYNWNLTSKPTGSTALLTAPYTVNPSLFLDKPGTYVGSLVVNDGLMNSAPDTITVNTINSPPTANAGANQTVRVNNLVTLDGSGSTDLDGNLLTLVWTLTTSPAGSISILSSTTAVKPTFTVDKPGTYVAQLIVNDGTVNSLVSQVVVSTENTPPVANAGPDQSLLLNGLVTLDGSASSDVDGDLLTYNWSFASSPLGSTATLSDATAVKPTFTVDKPGSYTLQLIVKDGTTNSLADTVVITTENSKPIANAGADQSAFIKQAVMLDGTSSSDADNDTFTYAWSFVSRPLGSTATLSGVTAPQPSFTLDNSGTYVVQLIVNDGKIDSAADTVTISTLNSKPVANAGAPQTVPVNTLVHLTGLASSDADGDSLTHAWSFTSKPVGSNATLIGNTTAEPSFTGDLGGLYVVELIVNDGMEASAPVTVSITVEPAVPVNVPPTFTSIPVIQATDGEGYSYQVTADDGNSDQLTYALINFPPQGMAITATGLITWIPSTAQVGDFPITVTVTDNKSAPIEQAFIITVKVATVTVPDIVGITQVAAQTAIAGANLTVGTITQTSSATVPLGNVISQNPVAGATVTKNTEVALEISTGPGGGTLPPDPATVAPTIDPTVATTTFAATQFLYTGNNPIQTGVAQGTIEAKRAAVIRGKVMDKTNAPLPGVTITILNHPEFGQTLSRSDGLFDMSVNGGGLIILNYAMSGYMTSQRQMDVPSQDYSVIEDVILIQQDSVVSTLDLTNATQAFQVAQGSSVTDTSGTRAATLMIPQGTQAQVYNPDGTTRVVSTLNLHLTEYTQGANGAAAMPGPLPPSSGYTYAIELKADEATVKKNGADVLFDRPVPFYVDNFLNMPVGIQVPVAYYDKDKVAWIPANDGKVIKILGNTAGLADIDTDGNGVADNAATLTSLGFTDAERIKLATYPAGKTLWRAMLTHLSTYDLNYGISPASGAVQPANPKPTGGPENVLDKPTCSSGSIIECENQTLGESINITGSSNTLNYRSDRVAGRKATNTLSIPLIGANVPATLKRIDLEITVAGRIFTQSFLPNPNQSYQFNWDGKDAYGRNVQGTLPTTISIGYVYQGFYILPPSMAASFGANSGQRIPGNIPSRNDITLWQYRNVSLGAWDARAQNMGGWTLSDHHAYDPIGKILYHGDGGRVSAALSVNTVIDTVAGNGTAGLTGDNGPATAASLNAPTGVAVGSDGSLYIAEVQNNTIRRVGPDGVITTVAGIGGVGAFAGDNGPATSARLRLPTAIDVAPDGSLYIADSGNNRIRRVGLDGVITTVAGNGTRGFSGDSGIATSAALSDPQDIALSPDGSIYIADESNHRIRRVAPNGIISTFAGNGTAGFSGDNGPATSAQITYPALVAVGPDGSIYFSDYGTRVRRVNPDGIITTVAGNGISPKLSGDGGPATAASFWGIWGLTVGRDGSIFISDGVFGIRRVNPEGIIGTVAGVDLVNGFNGDGGPSTAAQLRNPYGLALDLDGRLYIADQGNNRIRRIVNSVLPGFTATEIAIPSEDGSELYKFDSNGRHLQTLNALTGGVVNQFSYDTLGRLTSIVDGNGNNTAIERDVSGNPVAIVAPFGQRTTLKLDTNGYLASMTDLAGSAYQMSYTADGLLTRFQNPNNAASTMQYDTLGKLLVDTDAALGSQSLVRTELNNGYEVKRTTGLNRATTHRLESLTTGDQRRISILPDNTQTETVNKTNGSHVTTLSDGSVTTVTDGPDPRFSMQVPITINTTVATGGLTSTTSAQRTVNLTDPHNVLSLTALTDTVTVNGHISTRSYNAATKTFTKTTAENRSSTATIDNLGRMIQSQTSGMLAVNKTYDPQGRPATVAQGTGIDERLVSFTYNPQGYLASVTDPVGQQVKYDYDLVGRVTRQILPDNREILFTYDANGNLASLSPPGKPAHSFTYTPVNLTASYVPPNVVAGTNSALYTYNLDKQQTQVQRPDGLMMAYAYDAAGRTSALTVPEGIYSYTYNATTGKLTSVTAPDGLALNYTFNGGLPTLTDWSGAVAGNVGKTYDNDFRVSSISVNGVSPFTHQYDNDSLLTSVGNTTLGINLTLTHNAQNGLLTGTALGSLTDSYTYNGFGEATNYLAKYATADVYKTDLTRDKLGRITQKIETVAGVTSTFDYAYDLAGRLVEVKLNGIVQSSYGYDDNGNRTLLNSALIAHYDAQDRLLDYNNITYDYTANGELKTKAVGTNTTSYHYDILGNLRSAILATGTTIDYMIDGQNRRIGKKRNNVLEQGFLYQDQLKPVAELDGNGNVVSRFVYAIGINVPDFMIKGGVTYRIIKDHLGSPRLVVDIATNTVAQRMDFDAWGNVLQDTNPGFQPFGFAGGIYDKDTGLVRFGARDYDAHIGRWTTKDPIGLAGGINLYLYSAGDPINFKDSLGLKSPFEPIIDNSEDLLSASVAYFAKYHIETLTGLDNHLFSKIIDLGSAQYDRTRHYQQCREQVLKLEAEEFKQFFSFAKGGLTESALSDRQKILAKYVAEIAASE